MKSESQPEKVETAIVAPFAGAWIEILDSAFPGTILFVAPFAGAWIEMYDISEVMNEERVAPFAGAWIEI